MNIETLEDWNAILGQCCCPMPVCPVPDMDYEAIGGYGQAGYADAAYDEEWNLVLYGKWRQDYTDGGWWEKESPSSHWTKLGYDGFGDIWVSPILTVITEGGTTPTNGMIDTETRSNPVNVELAREASVAAMIEAVDWDTMGVDNNIRQSERINYDADSFPFNLVNITFVRFRWVIPDTWEGSYFKITWDVLTTPTDPEAEKSFVQDLTWVWSGPGDPEDEDSWKSPWYEITPPGDPGTKEVVNIRFECYKSTKFGNLPQVTGKSEDIDDDVPLQRRFTSDRHSTNLTLI